MTYRRKLIEVALPLEAINKESAREKSIRNGHPSTVHLWWARRPLAACRAVLWSSLVDDPSEYMLDEASANEERERLFKILENLVVWENINNEEVLDKARLEIARSVARNLGMDVPVGKETIQQFLATKAPPVLDPFAGGGSIPLEAQRLGLRPYASDLNPVAVLINKALIEIPPKFAGMPPVHPPENGDGKEKQKDMWDRKWKGAEGLAEDVRYYGKWMRDEAEKRIGHLYPKAKITEEILAQRPDLKTQGLKPGDELIVIAWLWARTVICPNPACGAQMPLVRSFSLSTKKGKEAWVEPVIEHNSHPPKVNFRVKTGKGKPLEGTVNRNGGRCVCCGSPVPFDHIRSEGKAGHMDVKLMAIVAENKTYLSPNNDGLNIVNIIPHWRPEAIFPHNPRDFKTPNYGMPGFADIFTSRQLESLSTFCDIVIEFEQKLQTDLKSRENQGNIDLLSYSHAISTFLAFSISRFADYWSSLNSWQSANQQLSHTFTRQALPMVWDYAEANPFSRKGGSFDNLFEWTMQSIPLLVTSPAGKAVQRNAMVYFEEPEQPIISTDPPYYDNIGYADLSDYFYIWLRKSLRTIYPELFGTLLVPKAEELVADQFRHGSKIESQVYFENGLSSVFDVFNKKANLSFPTTIYYAFKQTESDESDSDEANLETIASTGWETMLEGLVKTGFQITGTWPIRTELSHRIMSIGMNALASSIILVCRPRHPKAGTATRREFLANLKKELSPALRQLQLGSIAPVDLAQAAIGPGMAVFSRYSAVLESDGSPMHVRTALTLINQALDEYLTEQEGEYDSDTRWALAWYEQYGHNEAPYGVAEILSKAKNTSVEGLAEAGILEARGGKVRLLRRDELDTDWNPEKDKRLTSWESVQHLIFALDRNGEEAAAALLDHLGGLSETARDLAYRLYTVCERKSWAQDALAYNMLVVAWPRLKELAARKEPGQRKLL